MSEKLLAKNLRRCVEVYVNNQGDKKTNPLLGEIFSLVENGLKERGAKSLMGALRIHKQDKKKIEINTCNNLEKYILARLQESTPFHKAASALLESDILSGIIDKPNYYKRRSLRKPIKDGKIGIIIVHSSDTKSEAEALKYQLPWKYYRSADFSLIEYHFETDSWPSVAAQPGNIQDNIFNHIFSKADIAICIIKHKYGTPSYFRNGEKRFESGVEEEIYYMLKRHPDKILTMLYVSEESQTISLKDPDGRDKVKNLEQLFSLIDMYKDEITFKFFSSLEDLLEKAQSDLVENVKKYFVPLRSGAQKRIKA